MDMSLFPRRRLAHLPTPLEPMPRLSAHLGGPQLFVKRDDCTGLAGGGNKTRKLEFLIADALADGADTVITAGSVQSNHARQTAAAAAHCGLRCELVLPRFVPWEGPGYEVVGNVLLDRLLGAEVHLLPADTDRDAAMARVADKARVRGARPYVIPVGGSNALGALGYVECAAELLRQAADLGIAIDALVTASGSGGTQAGLVVGCQRLAADFPVIGMCDAAPAQELAETVRGLVAALGELLGGSRDIDWGRVEFLDAYAGAGYGLPTDAMVEAVTLAARLEGLLLDPVYTGKALAGLIDLVRRGRFRGDDTVVFVHTGGAAALDAYAGVFAGGGV